MSAPRRDEDSKPTTSSLVPHAGIGGRFSLIAEVMVSKIFPAGFGWQTSSIIADDLGYKATELPFFAITGQSAASAKEQFAPVLARTRNRAPARLCAAARSAAIGPTAHGPPVRACRTAAPSSPTAATCRSHLLAPSRGSLLLRGRRGRLRRRVHGAHDVLPAEEGDRRRFDLGDG